MVKKFVAFSDEQLIYVKKLEGEIKSLRGAISRVRNILHAHNRPDAPLPNESRLAARDMLDLALKENP
jgi:hypothetical protein